MVCEVATFAKRKYLNRSLFLFQGNFGNLDLPIEMPTEDDFKMMDENDDGVLTTEEWKEFIGC